MKKFTFLASLTIVFLQILSFDVNAQGGRKCATMDWLETQLRDNPIFRAQYQENVRKTEALMAQQIKDKKANPSANRTEAITYIPVVFHVVLTSAQQAAYPDALVLRQLDSLNKDWAGLNADSANVPAEFQAVRGHSNIQFCLAQRTPGGAATNGIVRVTSTTLSNTSTTNDPIKNSGAGGSSAWDPTKYVNIWLGNFTDPTLLGYASFPIGSPENPAGNISQQGVVVLAQTVPGGTAAPYNKGRTLTHELGHFFWLRHIWGDGGGCNSDFPTTTGLDDTPAQSGPTFGCPSTTQTAGCGSPTPPGKMYQNYMDYTDDGCMTMFTNGQNSRIDIGITNYRASLLTSDGCLAPAGFTFNSPAPVVSSCPAGASMSTTLTATYFGGHTADINLTASGNPPGTTVSFSVNPLTTGSTSTSVTLNGTNTLAAGTYAITVTGTSTGATTQNRNITFTINPGTGPSVTTQPSNQTVCAGQNATYSIVATGVTGYQWQVSTTGCAGSFTNIAGATSSSYTISGATAGQSGYGYRCVLTGLCGTTTSSCVTLTVNTAPAITGQPANISVCSGSAASFTVTATGSGIGYQWEVSTDGGTTWNPVGGATSATYTIASTTTGQSGNRYRCVVTGICPPAVTSSAAILTVNSSVTISSNPANSTICEVSNTSFTVAAGGSGLSYQWEVSTNGGTTWTNVTNGGVYGGATSATLTLTNVPPTFNTYRYRCTVSSPPCTPATSTAAILTVNTFPVITAQPTNVTICEFGNPTFSVTATTGVGSLSYQWQISTNAGVSWTNIAGATSSSYAQTNIPAGQNGYRFRVIVTAGCGSTTSNAGILTVNTYPVFDLTNIPVTLCLSDPAYALTASIGGGTWSGPGVSGGNFVPSVAGLGAKTVSYAVSNAGCVATKSAIVNVNECADRHRLLDAFQAVFVYPNPSNGIVNMRLNTDLYNSLGLRIFNAVGQEVKSELFTGLGFGSVVSTDLGRLPSGTYQFYLYNTQNGFIKKAVSVIYYKR